MNEQELVVALVDLIDSSDRERLLRTLAINVASQVLVMAAKVDKCPVPLPLIELPLADGELMPQHGVDSDELVASFLQHVRPRHEAHAYLDDHWNFIWEHAWPEGLAHVVLGPERHDKYAAADLLAEIHRVAEEIGLPEPPGFELADLETFVADWRRSFLQVLAEIKAG